MMIRQLLNNNLILSGDFPGTASLRQLLHGALLLLPAVILSAGCSLDEDTLQQALDKAQRATAGAKTWESNPNTAAHSDSDSLSISAGLLVSQEATENQPLPDAAPSVPFPDRLNPFEFGAGIDFDAPQTRDQEQLEIKLYGFAGTLPRRLS